LSLVVDCKRKQYFPPEIKSTFLNRQNRSRKSPHNNVVSDVGAVNIAIIFIPVLFFHIVIAIIITLQGKK